MPGVAARIASMGLLLWENLTLTQRTYQIHCHTKTWFLTGCTAVRGRQLDWWQNNWSWNYFSLAPLLISVHIFTSSWSCISFNLQQGVQSHDCSKLNLSVSVESFQHMDSQSAVAADFTVPSFKIVLMKKETRSSSQHQTTLTDQIKKQFLQCFPFYLQARRQAFIPHWGFLILPSILTGLDWKTSAFVSAWTRVHHEAVWYFLELGDLFSLLYPEFAFCYLLHSTNNNNKIQ